MKLYIGGLGHGQETLAEKENGIKPEIVNADEAYSARAIFNFEDVIKEVVRKGKTGIEFAEELCKENPDAIVVCNEIGYGIHPIDREERLWREQTGRALCVIAEHAESVTRVSCGIGQRIK